MPSIKSLAVATKTKEKSQAKSKIKRELKSSREKKAPTITARMPVEQAKKILPIS